MGILSEAKLESIIYTDSKGDVTLRTIVPTSVPRDTVRAIDVSELPADDQRQVQVLVEDYKEYVAVHMNAMFNFEQWCAHAHQISFDPKWRSFKVDSIKKPGE
jgi:protocatechuate 3,4-dioxygenase beta subunit